MMFSLGVLGVLGELLFYRLREDKAREEPPPPIPPPACYLL